MLSIVLNALHSEHKPSVNKTQKKLNSKLNFSQCQRQCMPQYKNSCIGKLKLYSLLLKHSFSEYL